MAVFYKKIQHRININCTAVCYAWLCNNTGDISGRTDYEYACSSAERAYYSAGMIAHFDISRERSLRAVEEAMEQDQKIYLVTQRNVDSEDPTQEDLYQMGIVADIKQVVRLQNDVVRILVDGISRAALLGFTGNEKYLEAEICYCDSNADSLPEDLREAMLLGVREAFHRYAASRRQNQQGAYQTDRSV